MAHNQELGNRGENIANDFLVSKGYEILERNWRFKKAEIDIIAKDINNNILVFFEVKTRSYTYFGEPEAFVDEKKQKFISDAASEYMRKINYNWAIRFDIIGIVINKNNVKTSHFEDAFFM